MSTVCAECREEITESAQTCPHCNYSPRDEYAKRADNYLKVAIVGSLFIVLLPVAPFLLWGWRRNRKKSKKAMPGVDG